MKYTTKEIQEKADEIVELFSSLQITDYEDSKPIRIRKIDRGLALLSARTHVQLMIKHFKGHEKDFWISIMSRLF